MAKLTLSGLKTYVDAYVATAKQAGSWSASTDNIAKLLDKVGKMVMLDGGFADKLPEMNGDNLPYGKTIEEYFMDLTLPAAFARTGTSPYPYDYTTEGAKDIVPNMPTFESVVYNYTLGKQKIKTTVPYNDLERAAIDGETAGNLIAKIYQRLQDSYALTTYASKKQLIGNLIQKINTTAALKTAIAKPVDTTTAEAFIEKVKEFVETASFANEGNNLGNSLAGSAENLVLYLKKGIMPAIEVKAMAGAFNKEDLLIPCKIKVLDDFGTQSVTSGGVTTGDANVYAVLVDERALKLHTGYEATRTSPNADGDFVNVVKHFEHTGFISKYAFVHEFTTTGVV